MTNFDFTFYLFLFNRYGKLYENGNSIYDVLDLILAVD